MNVAIAAFSIGIIVINALLVLNRMRLSTHFLFAFGMFGIANGGGLILGELASGWVPDFKITILLASVALTILVDRRRHRRPWPQNELAR